MHRGLSRPTSRRARTALPTSAYQKRAFELQDLLTFFQFKAIQNTRRTVEEIWEYPLFLSMRHPMASETADDLDRIRLECEEHVQVNTTAIDQLSADSCHVHRANAQNVFCMHARSGSAAMPDRGQTGR